MHASVHSQILNAIYNFLCTCLVVIILIIGAYSDTFSNDGSNSKPASASNVAFDNKSADKGKHFGVISGGDFPPLA